MKITLDWINSIPRVITKHGCWIPVSWKPNKDGYIDISIGSRKLRRRYYLHRLSMCAFHNLDYNTNLETRHSKDCSKACFNYEHLIPGSTTDNSNDIIEHGKNTNLNKDRCPKCGGQYKNSFTMSKGKRRWQRYCPRCQKRNKEKKDDKTRTS